MELLSTCDFRRYEEVEPGECCWTSLAGDSVLILKANDPDGKTCVICLSGTEETPSVHLIEDDHFKGSLCAVLTEHKIALARQHKWQFEDPSMGEEAGMLILDGKQVFLTFSYDRHRRAYVNLADGAISMSLSARPHCFINDWRIVRQGKSVVTTFQHGNPLD